MLITFEEKQHIYSVNGDIASISVTELLAKHGLAPNFKGVNKNKLKESAEIGKKVHKDLENILNKPKYTPETPQGVNFYKWVQEELDCGVGEQLLAYEYNGMLIAGTADIMGILKNGEYLVADHKNTAKFHREYVSWQVSLLDYFARKIGNEKINGVALNWKGASRFICFHYDKKTGEMTAYELEKIPDREIERLIECEYKGEIYKRLELVVENEIRDRFLQAEQKLAEIELLHKQAKSEVDELRAKMLELFEEQGITKWTSPSGLIEVTYVAPCESVSVDSKKLKAEFPTAFSKCQKITSKKSYVRVSIKEKDLW